MKVTFYFREHRKGMFSIENLFNTIIEVTGANVKVFVFTIKSAWHLKSIARAFFVQGDINHITGDVNYLALFLRGAKTVLTIHDIGHYEYTLRGWKKYIYKKIWFEWPLRRVSRITTVSEFTKQKLIATFNVDPDKIKVIYNPVPMAYKASSRRGTSDTLRILQIGSGINKNLEALIKASEGLPCHFILLREYDQKIDNRIKEMGLQVTWHYNLTNEEVLQLYIDSDLLYFASTYEGFGMPIIEAQAVGRPVITSNVASMPEIGGDGVCLVDPYSIDEIRVVIKKIISDEKYSEELVAKGFENIKRFQAAYIGQQYMNLYTDLYRSQK